MPYIELGNLSLHYKDAGLGDPPVLLLHELGGSSESWRRVIPLITQHRRVIVPAGRRSLRQESTSPMLTTTSWLCWTPSISPVRMSLARRWARWWQH